MMIIKIGQIMARSKLKPVEREFVNEFLANGNNATQAVATVYKKEVNNSTRVKASRLLTKDNIQKAFAERLPDDLLEERHLELLNKREIHISKLANGQEVAELIDQPDTQAVSKGLDMAYKIKSTYAPEKHTSTSVNINLDESKVKELNDRLQKIYDRGNEGSTLQNTESMGEMGRIKE
jgi:phage terminase small subunit